MNSKFSIIIPVYNAEKYISRCMDSVLHQTVDNFECILIDDGSSDNSGQICDEYAQKDTRIKVFHKNNCGVSSARNVGIENACGEWIYFVDADDLLEENCLKAMEERIDGAVDMVVGAYKKIFVDSQKSITSKVPGQTYTFEQFLIVLTDVGPDSYEGYIWNKIFRKVKIDQYQIRFDEEICYNEDRLFLVKYLCATKGNIVYTPQTVYKYMIHSDSAMGILKGVFNYKYVTDFSATERIITEISQKGLSDRICRKWDEMLICSFYNIIAQMLKSRSFDRKLFLNLFKRCRRRSGFLKIIVYCVHIFLKRVIVKLK